MNNAAASSFFTKLVDDCMLLQDVLQQDFDVNDFL